MGKKQKRKNYIDKELYDEIMIAMKRSGIPPEVFSIAKKMDMNLPYEFKEKIFDLPNIVDQGKRKEAVERNKEYFSKNLLGIYGNYFATYYYSSRYKVENEKPVYNENGNLDGKADLFFLDENGNENYCEVKATPYILGYQNGFSKQKEILKYQKMGEKLLRQAAKLKRTNANVIVVLFDGCQVDKEISEKLKEMEIKVQSLQINIDMLESFIDDLIGKIEMNFYNKNNSINNRKIG